MADLSALAPFHCNDMVVDARGRAYIGNFGFDMLARATPRPTGLILVEPDGRARVVAEDLHFPNGMVITPDGGTLIVAESYAGRLSAFDIQADGALAQRRVWAQLPERVGPDGICLDAEGAVWLASPVTREVLRVRAGGEVTHRVPTAGQATACMLGGADRRTLFILSASSSEPDACRRNRDGRIQVVTAPYPGAGLP